MVLTWTLEIRWWAPTVVLLRLFSCWHSVCDECSASNSGQGTCNRLWHQNAWKTWIAWIGTSYIVMGLYGRDVALRTSTQDLTWCRTLKSSEAQSKAVLVCHFRAWNKVALNWRNFSFDYNLEALLTPSICWLSCGCTFTGVNVNARLVAQGDWTLGGMSKHYQKTCPAGEKVRINGRVSKSANLSI